MSNVKLQWAAPDIDKHMLPTTHAEIIRFAVSKGVWFDFETQELVTHTGRRVKPKLYGNQRYPAYTIATSGKHRVSFHIHKLAAFLLFGEMALEAGVHVRHIDGDSLNLSVDNLALGSGSDNEHDKPPEGRARVAKIARAAQIAKGISSPNAKLTHDQASDLVRDYLIAKAGKRKAPNGFIQRKAKELGISESGIKAIVGGKYRKHTFNEVKNEQC